PNKTACGQPRVRIFGAVCGFSIFWRIGKKHRASRGPRKGLVTIFKAKSLLAHAQGIEAEILLALAKRLQQWNAKSVPHPGFLPPPGRQKMRPNSEGDGNQALTIAGRATKGKSRGYR
ncbi:MAG: hypothetical protein LBT33_09415, partial [Spirochaetia bacterium]|nr:hypothetical protein [Spirochaetia bacterium]